MNKKNQRKPESFISEPLYAGGKKAMNEFIKSNLIYPEEALKNKIEGTVTVAFDVDVYGSVSDAKIKHGLGSGCNEEALRLVSLLQFQKKKYKGMRVTFHKMINIHFRLHEARKLPEQTLNYQYTEKKKAEQQPGLSYTITIKPN